MALDHITARLLEDTLKAWEQDQEPPAGLLNLVLLGVWESDSPVSIVKAGGLFCLIRLALRLLQGC